MTLGSISLKVGEKTDSTPQIRRNSAKSGVKTAKKPILREKCAPATTSPKTSRLDNLGGKFHRWTAEEALAAGKKGGQTFAIRNALRKDFERSAAEGGKLSAIFEKAINTQDLDLITFVEKAAKLVGATFDQSEEARQKIELAGKLDNNLNVKIESVK